MNQVLTSSAGSWNGAPTSFSYQWQSWGLALLDTESGGADGGASRLTPQAQELVRRFRSITAGVQEEAAARFAAAFRDMPGALTVSSDDRSPD